MRRPYVVEALAFLHERLNELDDPIEVLGRAVDALPRESERRFAAFSSAIRRCRSCKGGRSPTRGVHGTRCTRTGASRASGSSTPRTRSRFGCTAPFCTCSRASCSPSCRGRAPCSCPSWSRRFCPSGSAWESQDPVPLELVAHGRLRDPRCSAISLALRPTLTPSSMKHLSLKFILPFGLSGVVHTSESRARRSQEQDSAKAGRRQGSEIAGSRPDALTAVSKLPMRANDVISEQVAPLSLATLTAVLRRLAADTPGPDTPALSIIFSTISLIEREASLLPRVLFDRDEKRGDSSRRACGLVSGRLPRLDAREHRPRGPAERGQ